MNKAPFFDRLEERARQTGSLLCVGLDPHPADLPKASAQAARDHCLRLIEATADLALAFKPNAAFFELYAEEGVAALRQVIAAVPQDVPVILDAKRGDIDVSAAAYARAAFEALGADAVTVSPYLGGDALAPFLEYPAHGIFLLCKTSNAGSSDLQDLRALGQHGWQPIYEHVARLAQTWNTNCNLGLVVGATHPQALRRVRSLAPDLWMLTPGVGAQGGDVRLALQAGLRRDGLGLLLTVSRGLSRTRSPRQAAEDLLRVIQRERATILSSLSARQEIVPFQSAERISALAEGLLEAGCVRFGQFTLKSGLVSPIYIDLRRLVSSPSQLLQVAETYLPVLRGLIFQRLAALPYAAIPIGTIVSLLGGWPLIYPRKEVKAYGTRAEIEGDYSPGEQVVVLDDLATTGESKLEALRKLTAAGLRVTDVVVLIDRQSGAAQALSQQGIGFHAVVTLTQLLDYWEQYGKVPADQLAAARAFLHADAA